MITVETNVIIRIATNLELKLTSGNIWYVYAQVENRLVIDINEQGYGGVGVLPNIMTRWVPRPFTIEDAIKAGLTPPVYPPTQAESDEVNAMQRAADQAKIENTPKPNPYDGH